MGGRGVVSALLWVLLACAAGAQELDLSEGLDQVLEEGSIELSADHLEYERSRGLYTARGNVVLRQATRTIRADWISFNQQTGVGVASGNVVVEEEDSVLRASFVEFDVNGVRGMVRDGEFESSATQMRARGRVIEKTGQDTYRFEEGSFTTCRCPEPDEEDPWRITAEEAELEVEGYATVEDTTLDVLGVPVVWLPYMIFPVKTKRQSGLLLPEFEFTSRNGAMVGLPIFLALGDPVNLTLTPGYSNKRGGRGRAELEYVFGERSAGELTGVFANDISLDKGRLEFGEPFDRERWAALGSHDLHGPLGLRFKARFDLAADNQMPIDFNELRPRRADRRLLQQGWLGRGFGDTERYGALVGTRFADDVQNPDDRDRDDTILQRMVGGQASLLAGGLWPDDVPWLPRLVAAMEVDYARFWRDDSVGGEFPSRLGPGGDFLDTGVDAVATEKERCSGGQNADGDRGALPPCSSTAGMVTVVTDDPHGDDFDPVANPGGTELDGRFQEGEILLDQGHRFVLHPKLALPFQLGRFFEIYPEVGWHQTLYETNRNGFEERGFLTGRVDARTRLRRPVGDGWVHVIEPKAGWAYVEGTSESDNPLFVPRTAIPQLRLRALDLDSVTRDDADRIRRANFATAGVTNRFLKRDGRQRIEVTGLALYDFNDQKVDQLVGDATFHAAYGFRGRMQLGYDPAARNVEEGLAALGWRHQSGMEASMTYRYLRRVANTFEEFPFGDRWDSEKRWRRVNQLRGAVTIPFTRRWTAAMRASYSFERSKLLSSAASLEYFSRCDCWSAGAEFSGDRVSGIGFKLLYSIQGFGFTGASTEEGVLDGI